MEMQKLIKMLTEANIPFEVRQCWGTPQVCYPPRHYGYGTICDAVCHEGSYGYSAGLLEIMGLVDFEEVGDEVEGWLTAEEVFSRIQNHYQKNFRETS